MNSCRNGEQPQWLTAHRARSDSPTELSVRAENSLFKTNLSVARKFYFLIIIWKNTFLLNGCWSHLQKEICALLESLPQQVEQ